MREDREKYQCFDHMSVADALAKFFRMDTPPLGYLSCLRDEINRYGDLFSRSIKVAITNLDEPLTAKYLTSGKFDHSDIMAIYNVIDDAIEESKVFKPRRSHDPFTHPLEKLTSEQIFKLKKKGDQIYFVDHEFLRRAKSDNNFVEDLAKYVDDTAGIKKFPYPQAPFKYWCEWDDRANMKIRAQIISELARHEAFGSRYKNLLDFLDEPFVGDEHKTTIVSSYLKYIDNPEQVFSSAGKEIYPVSMAFHHHKVFHGDMSVFVDLIEGYIDKHIAGREIASVNYKTRLDVLKSKANEIAEQINTFSSNSCDLNARLSRSLSVLSGPSLEYQCNESDTNAVKILSSSIIDDGLTEIILKKLLRSGGTDPIELASLAESKRNYDIISNVISRDELMSFGSKKSKGHLVFDDIGL